MSVNTSFDIQQVNVSDNEIIAHVHQLVNNRNRKNLVMSTRKLSSTCRIRLRNLSCDSGLKLSRPVRGGDSTHGDFEMKYFFY